MTSRFLVYGLLDPFTDELRYIGATTRGLRRPREHWSPYFLRVEGPTYKTNWLRKVLRLGAIPRVIVLRECERAEEVWEAEASLIAQHRSAGARLTNRATGGKGPFGCVRSEETKLKMRLARLGKPRPAWVIARMREGHARVGVSALQTAHATRLGSSWKGKVRSPATKARMAKAKRQWWKENREAHTQRLRENGLARRGTYVMPPESRAKLSAAKKGVPKSEETKARMSEAKRKWWLENHEAQTQRLRESGATRRGKHTLSSVTRAEMSAARKGIPKSDETRARMVEAQRLRRTKERELENEIVSKKITDSD